MAIDSCVGAVRAWGNQVVELLVLDNGSEHRLAMPKARTKWKRLEALLSSYNVERLEGLDANGLTVGV